MILLHRTHNAAHRARALEIIRQFDEFEGVAGRTKPATTSEDRSDQIFFRPQEQIRLSPELSERPHTVARLDALSMAADQDLGTFGTGDASRTYFAGHAQYNCLPIVRQGSISSTSEPLHPGQRCLMHAYLSVLQSSGRGRSDALASRSTAADEDWRLQFPK